MSFRRFLLGFLIVSVAACEHHELTQPRPTADNVLSIQDIPVRDLPALQIEVPDPLPPWHATDAALVDALRNVGGVALIAVKEPSAAPTAETGTRAAISSEAIRKALRLVGDHGVIRDYFPDFGIAAAEIQPSIAPTLRAHPLIDYISPEDFFELDGISSPVGGSETLPWGVEMVGAPQAWEWPATGTSARLMIIDTGHDQGHEDLPLIPAENCGGLYDGCSDALGHGTRVFGVIAARDNTFGVVGVSPGISDVFVEGSCDDNGSCIGVNKTGIIESIQKAIDLDVDVLNMSFGSGRAHLDLQTVVTTAWQDDVLMVASAGNNCGPCDRWPASYDEVISVSGIKDDKAFADWSPCGDTSNYGDDVELTAPFWSYTTEPGDTYKMKCGTSYSAPHVAGVAAIVRSEFPSWSNQKVRDQLTSKAEDLGDAGRDDLYGYGLVRALYSLFGDYGVSVWVTGPSVIAQSDGYVMIGASGTYTFDVTLSGTASPHTYEWWVRYHSEPSGEFQPVTTQDPGYIDISGCDGNLDVRLKIYDSTNGHNQHDIFVENMASCW